MLDFYTSVGIEHASSSTQNAHNSYSFSLPPDTSMETSPASTQK